MNGERFTVLVTDKVLDSGLEPLRADDRFDVVKIDDSTDPAFADALSTAHGLIVRSATKVGAEMLATATALRVVGRAGVGVDNIDLAAATERGIAVLNAPAGNTVSAAELTLALILSMVRCVAEADASIRAGEWARSRFKGAELRGRTPGLVGAGSIGGEGAKRWRGCGMSVVGDAPHPTRERAARRDAGGGGPAFVSPAPAPAYSGPSSPERCGKTRGPRRNTSRGRSSVASARSMSSSARRST